MEESRLRCPRCGSVDLQARLGTDTRCWRCGAVTPLAAPTPRTLPDLSNQPRATTILPSNTSTPVQIAPDKTFVISATVPRTEAEALIQKNLRWFFRPADIDKAEFSPVTMMYAPIWRIDAAIESFFIGIQHSTNPSGVLRWVVPTGGFRHRDGVLLLPGRRFLAVNPCEKIKIDLSEMQLKETQPDLEGEVLAPDVQQNEAEYEAVERLRQKVQSQGALYVRFAARVRSAALCYYPLWVMRYRYQGSALWRSHSEECHVAVSGRRAEIVSAKHPSVVWSLLDRARRMVSAPPEPK
jgi:hypothetical protein